MRYLTIMIFCLISSGIQAEVFTASYQEQLKKTEFVEKMKKMGANFTEADRAIMQKARVVIDEQTKNAGIQVGQKAPNFQLQNAFGQTVSLADELAKGPVVLVFYRGAWCPYCNLHLYVLKESLPAFNEFGARLITVTPQLPDQSRKQFADDGAPFEVLSDLDYKVMEAYRLYFELPADLSTVYKKVDLDIEAYNGAGRLGLPVPGTFVIDQSGIVRAMHAESDYTQRMEPQAIVEVLKNIAQTN
jgi:peroxiredoxin